MNTALNGDTEPSGDERPEIKDGTHPIITTRYTISTPQIEELCDQVVHWVKLRNPGAIVYAPPRHGKTRSLDVLLRELADVYQGMPILLLPAWDYTQPREKPFLSDLLTAAGHALSRSGTADEMRDRLVNLLTEQGTVSGEGRVLLIIDEAQNLHPKHYNWLIGIHNMLSLREVNLIVLLVGQRELLAQKTAFVRTNKAQIVGRFMVHNLEFHGVRSDDDIEDILKAYDMHTEYPPGSGWSFSRYYAAEHFSKGWRLAALKTQFWSGFWQVRRAAPKARRKGDIPMQYVCRTIEHFLTNLAEINLNDNGAVEKLVSSAIGMSGYIETLIM